MSSALGGRLRSARRVQFVGREAEQRLFAGALAEPELPFYLLCLFGPGGVVLPTPQRSPRQAKLYRALYHTYFQPAPTQERAAEVLDLPFSTFRRHLKAGISQLTEMLWQREIGGLEK